MKDPTPTPPVGFCSLPVLQNLAVVRGGECSPFVPMPEVLEYVFWVSELYGAAPQPRPRYELVSSSNKSNSLEILMWSSRDVPMAYF